MSVGGKAIAESSGGQTAQREDRNGMAYSGCETHGIAPPRLEPAHKKKGWDGGWFSK